MPDLRNSRVVDVIRELLEDYGCREVLARRGADAAGSGSRIRPEAFAAGCPARSGRPCAGRRALGIFRA